MTPIIIYTEKPEMCGGMKFLTIVYYIRLKYNYPKNCKIRCATEAALFDLSARLKISFWESGCYDSYGKFDKISSFNHEINLKFNCWRRFIDSLECMQGWKKNHYKFHNVNFDLSWDFGSSSFGSILISRSKQGRVRQGAPAKPNTDYRKLSKILK